MSYATGTTFYNLPQTVGTDKRDWFDANQAFADVDAALHAAATGQEADAEAIAAINLQLASDEADIAALQSTTSTHTTQIAALSTATSQNISDIADVRSDSQDMITAYNEGSAATSTRAYAIGDYFIYNDVLYKATAAITIGDTIVPNTNCEATNVTTEIGELNSDLANKWAIYDFTHTITLATADGVKTVGELLQEAATALHSVHISDGFAHQIIRFDIPSSNDNSKLVMANLYDRFITDYSNISIITNRLVANSASSMNIYASIFSSGVLNAVTVNMETGNIATTDLSTRVPANGTTLTMEVTIYKKLN